MENTKDKNSNKPKIDLTKVIMTAIRWMAKIIIAYIENNA